MPTSTGQFGGGTSAPASPDMSVYGIPPLGVIPQPGKVSQPVFVPQPGANAPGAMHYMPPQDAGMPVQAAPTQQPAEAPPMPGMGQIPAATPAPLPMAAQSQGMTPQAQPSPTAYGQNKFSIKPHVDLSGIADYLISAHHGVESSGEKDPYTVRTKIGGSSASGKYQYTKPTWNNFGGFPEAALAPPDVQEKRMRQDVMARLQRFGGDPFKAAADHYYPAYASDPTKWDSPITANGKPNGKLIVDQHGNPRPTVRQYLNHIFPPQVLDRYAGQFAKGPVLGAMRG